MIDFLVELLSQVHHSTNVYFLAGLLVDLLFLSWLYYVLVALLAPTLGLLDFESLDVGDAAFVVEDDDVYLLLVRDDFGFQGFC